MKAQFGIATVATILAAALLMVACEDSSITAPIDGAIVTTANPDPIIIDSGETEGTSVVQATAFDINGFPLAGIQITFSPDGGEIITENPVTTDSNGIARATVRTGKEGDPTVKVTAESGAIADTVEIGKVVVGPNLPPFATFTAIPPTTQQAGQTVVFDGSLSIDQDGEITCFHWTIASTDGVCTGGGPGGITVGCQNDMDCVDQGAPGPCDQKYDEVHQGAGASSIPRKYDVATTLTVTLRVSDDPTIGSQCSSDLPPIADGMFSPNSETQIYEISCQPPPIANAGEDIDVPCTEANVVYLEAEPLSSDDGQIVQYLWDCGNGKPSLPADRPGTDPTGSRVICQYGCGSGGQVYTATLTVIDNGTGVIDPETGTFACQAASTDTKEINVFEPGT